MNKMLIQALKGLKPTIQSGVANWGNNIYYFSESDKAELIAEIDALEKPAKTLGKLGFKKSATYIVYENVQGVQFTNSGNKKIFLYSDGEFDVTGDFYLDQEVHAAIEQEMKKAGMVEMSYYDTLNNKFDGFIKNKNLMGATRCVELMFGVKPHIALSATELHYKNGVALVDAVDQCVDRDFKEGKI